MYLTQHHRKCRSNGGDNSPKNLSLVEAKKHMSWHNLFNNAEPDVIADIINHVWLDPDWELIAQKKSDRRYMEEGLQ